MRETDAYIMTRRNSRKRGGADRKRPRKALGILVSVLLLLTAGICAAVYFIPRSAALQAGGSPVFGGKTFYALATAEETERINALTAAQYAVERGGAGFIYNDGNYKVVAALYERESDAKTLALVNEGSYCFEISLPKSSCGANDLRALEYLTGEWFSSVFDAANELNRGGMTDSAAEHAVITACSRLSALAEKAETPRLADALASACEYSMPDMRSVLSYIRYVHVRGISTVAAALK